MAYSICRAESGRSDQSVKRELLSMRAFASLLTRVSYDTWSPKPQTIAATWVSNTGFGSTPDDIARLAAMSRPAAGVCVGAVEGCPLRGICG